MVPARRAHARPLLVSTTPSLPAAAAAGKKKMTKKKAVKAGVTAQDVTAESADQAEAAPDRSESSHLREQLLHVLVDHQRQEEEIVALRALARSLKEEVELIHKQQQQNAKAASYTKQASTTYDNHREKRPHEFFKLDLQLEQLRSEHAQVRNELCDANEELESLRGFVARELPQFKIAAVQAKAELECVRSQLQDERAHCDRLEAQVAHYRARSGASAPARTPTLRKHLEHDSSTKLESHRQQAVHATRDATRREREQFLLQCRLSAVANDDKENSECSGNGGDGGSDAVDELSEASGGRSGSPPHSVASSRSSSWPSSYSSRVHRDLSVLDRELRALRGALTLE